MLKINLLFFLILVFFISCQPNNEVKKKITQPNPSVSQEQAVQTDKKERVINSIEKKEIEPSIKPAQESEKTVELLIHDASQYSEQFLSKLKSINGTGKMELNGDQMILFERDTILFPDVPLLNQHTIFTGRKDDLAIALTVKRINFSSIEYQIEMVEFGKATNVENGIADLGLFFLGAESDVDDLTNETFFTAEYANTKDTCYTSIRIGNVEDTSTKPLLAKISKNCNGEIKDINIDNFTTLREK